MQGIRRFRQQLDSGQICIGASVSYTDPLVTDALADSVDFLWIDLEHGGMSPEALAGHLLAARGHGVPAIVRCAGSVTPFIKPVLDLGAEGVIVPQVRSVEEVRGVVAACLYPPLGERGYGPRVPTNYGRGGGRQFCDGANGSILVAVQIETVEALDLLEEIAGIEGLNSLVIGPYDLSSALGVLGDVRNPSVLDAIDRVVAAARRRGLYVGAGMGPDTDYACLLASRGVQWLQIGNDYGYLVNEAERISGTVRSHLKELHAEIGGV